MGLLCGLSIPYIRTKCYELFLVGHILFAVILLVALFQCVLLCSLPVYDFGRCETGLQDKTDILPFSELNIKPTSGQWLPYGAVIGSCASYASYIATSASLPLGICKQLQQW